MAEVITYSLSRTRFIWLIVTYSFQTGFAKIGHTAVSKPQWIGFSSKKTGCDKLES